MKTIIWDVDDTLNTFTRDWISETSQKVSYDQLTENPPNNILKMSMVDYQTSIDNFRRSYTASKARPNQEILSWFQQNGFKFKHIALTARPVDMVAPAADWVFHYLGQWIRTFSFVPSFRKNQIADPYEKKKEDFLSWLGHGDYLVDDNLENIQGFNSMGKQGVVFPQPWNASKKSVQEVLSLLV